MDNVEKYLVGFLSICILSVFILVAITILDIGKSEECLKQGYMEYRTGYCVDDAKSTSIKFEYGRY